VRAAKICHFKVTELPVDTELEAGNCKLLEGKFLIQRGRNYVSYQH
jgi:hypothetical protein